jgi:mannan endo-1,4-beta-mannosidase
LSGTFKNTGTAWGVVSAGKFKLHAGANKAVVLDGWGYFEIDYIDVSVSSVAPPKPPPNKLADPQATTATRKLMSFLIDTFGKKVLAGTQVRNPTLDAVAYALKASGKRPALVEGGLLEYSPSFVDRAGNVSNGYIEAVGKWAKTAGNGHGLVALCWHWNSPCDLMDTTAHPDSSHPWYQAFYTKNTNFNLSYALANPQSEQYTKLLRDLDTIAIQLQKMSDLGKR